MCYPISIHNDLRGSPTFFFLALGFREGFCLPKGFRVEKNVEKHCISDYEKYLFRALNILAKSTFSRKVNLVETENYLGPVTYLSENLLLISYLTNIIFFNSART
jgi:hypothetical protein